MPLAVVAGHRKAVSYVRFLGGSQLVSASTDSRLKVWDVTAMANSQGQAKPCCTLTGLCPSHPPHESMHIEDMWEEDSIHTSGPSWSLLDWAEIIA